MSFAWPAALAALVAIPVLIRLYAAAQRRRARAARAFVAAPLLASLAPGGGPGARRHLPIAITALALTALVLAAARPQTSVAVPLTDGAVMLVNDTSASMAAQDVRPTRLGAAENAARAFIARLPGTVRVGFETFAVQSVVRQSPTADHALARDSIRGLTATGHTAIGDALTTALGRLTGLRAANGRRPPGAIVLISDGTSTDGADPRQVARRAATLHIPIDTVSVGTARGTIAGSRGATRVPVDPSELQAIARLSGGQTFSAGDANGLDTVYRSLAARIGHRTAQREVTDAVAGAGLALLLAGAGTSLLLFGRPI